jgi:hypothetical protein
MGYHKTGSWRTIACSTVLSCVPSCVLACWFVLPSNTFAELTPIFTWQANQPIAIENRFAGSLYKVDGTTLLLGDGMFHEDESAARHTPWATDRNTVFSIDYERVTINDLQGGGYMRGNAWLPMRGPARLFVNEESPTAGGKILKIDGNKIICPTTIYWIDHMATTVTFDDHTKVFYSPDVYVPEVPVLKQAQLTDLKAGMQIEAVQQSDVASKIFISPVFKSDDVSMAHSKSIASLPAREFNSKLSLQVYLDPATGMFSDPGERLGSTPSEKPLAIPAGRMWYIVPGADVPREELAAEINRQQIPGLALPDVPAGSDLSFLDKLPNLRSLRLIGPGVTDAAIAHISVMTNLEELYLPSDQNLTDDGISHLKEFSELIKLDLSGTKLTCTGLNDFALTALEMLNLGHSGVTDEGLHFIEGCNNIVGVYLAGTKLTDAAMQTFQTLGTMHELDLEGTSVGDEGLKNFENLSDLVSLNLKNTKVTGAGMEYLQEMTSLLSFNVAGTQIDDRGLQYIRLMLPLQMLDLSGTLVGDGGLEQLKGLKSLRALNLASSKVTASGAATMKQALPDCTIEYP